MAAYDTFSLVKGVSLNQTKCVVCCHEIFRWLVYHLKISWQHTTHLVWLGGIPGPYFGKLCAFSQNIKQLWTKYSRESILWIGSEMFQGTQKAVYFSGDHCCKVTVKIVPKSIFFHVLSHKSITT